MIFDKYNYALQYFLNVIIQCNAMKVSR